MQLYWRVWLKVYRPGVPKTALPDRREWFGGWVVFGWRAPSMLAKDRFVFLNKEGGLVGREDWNDPEQEKLWLYNLHYFDDLNAEGADRRGQWHRALIQRWIDENPVGEGNGWEPYPLSLRIVNWIKWALQGNRMEAEWDESLAVQARYLRQQLEYHLLGNHLFANAKALVFAGLYFSGAEADEWLRKGLAILAREVPEQILADGGHFELSPMYHAIILEDMLDLLNLGKVYGGDIETRATGDTLRLPLELWSETARDMLRWFTAMCHPDGELSFFNDATLGIAANLGDLRDYFAQVVGPWKFEGEAPLVELPASGYIRVAQGQSVALLDVGQIGPDYLPGHAHADTLSFELSYRGQRIIVNGGISRYGAEAERLHQRGTAMHSTVVVNHSDSSEVWGGFRVARRARPFGLRVEKAENEISVSCAHDGYKRLPGKPVHRRTWSIQPEEVLVRDEVKGACEQAVAYYHIHPDVDVVRAQDGKSGRLNVGDESIAEWYVSGGRVSVESGCYHPGFGLDESAQVIRVEFENNELMFRLRWL